ncbi:MAG: hypothetical protein CHACPFDD_02869 [Phycisphaerae bacterium]|nr:hypothetical protein [Phycisphaerae bacterium]
MEPSNLLLDDYILGLTRKRRPRICFIPTASGDSDNYVARFYAAFRPPRADPAHLPLFGRDGDPAALRRRIFEQDVIYVGGGNTANLLAVWRTHGVDRLLRQAWRQGVILAGISAGMLCWFEGGVTDSFGPLAVLNDGLGLLPGSACPHYDGEPQRRPTFQRLVASGAIPAGYAADDGAAMHFVGRRLKACVSSRPGARAYRVIRRAGKEHETALPTRYLGRAPA